MIGGFTMKWQLKGASIEQEPDNNQEEEIWHQTLNPEPLRKNMNVLTAMNLVHESNVKMLDNEILWDLLMEQRRAEKMRTGSACFDEDQGNEMLQKAENELHKIASHLNLEVNHKRAWVPADDLVLGVQLYSLIQSCPVNLVEADEEQQLEMKGVSMQGEEELRS